MYKTIGQKVLLGVAVLGVMMLSVNVQPALANLLTADFEGSDCSGFFGQGFGSCQIYDDPNDGETIELSPVIIKFNASLGTDETNDLYGAIDGSELSFSGITRNGDNEILTGTWTYVPDDVPGPAEAFDFDLHDPAIKYWAAKTSSGFRLFWEVNDSALEANGGVCDPADPFSIPCLNQALVQTNNIWTTLDGKGLSHLTFYDTVPPRNPPEIPGVPEPATMLLLGSGLVGVAGVARRRIKK